MTSQHPVPGDLSSKGFTGEEINTQSLLSRIGFILALAYAATALLVASADIIFVLRHFTRYPFGDHWAWLAHLVEHGLSNALFSQYNEHRLFFPGLFYWADVRFFAGRNVFIGCATVVLNVACIFAIAFPFLSNGEVPRAVRYTFFGFVTIVMLWYIQGTNFFYSFQLCLPLANIGILSAIFLFTLFYKRDSLRQPNTEWLLIGSIVCGFVGTFSYAHGILIWPLLLLNAAILRLRVRHVVTIAGSTMLALAFYFWHYSTPPLHSSPLESIRDPFKLVVYSFMMIGLPWLTGPNAALGWRLNIMEYAIILGGLSSAACLIVIYFFRLGKDSCSIFYSSVLMLAMGSVAITASGRSKFPVEQALSGRYAPIPLLFWISLIALVTIYLCRFEAPGGLGRAVWCVALAGISFATLPTQFIMGAYLAGRERAQEAAVDSIAIGAPDESALSAECAFPRVVDRRLMLLFRRLSVFQLPEGALLGNSLEPRFKVTGICESNVDEVRLYQGDLKNAVHLSGWLFDKARGTNAAKILVTDQGGAIIGFGIGEMRRPDVAAVFHNASMEDTGWSAYSQLPADGSRKLRIFGELPGGSAVCEVVSPKTLLP